MRPSSSTMARTVILALALINQILIASGHSALPIDDETINEIVSTCFTIAAAVTAWWKNNSFSRSAIAADEMMKKAKRR